MVFIFVLVDNKLMKFYWQDVQVVVVNKEYFCFLFMIYENCVNVLIGKFEKSKYY